MKEIRIKDKVVKIDDEDFDNISSPKYKWYLGKNGYIVGWLPNSNPRVYVYLHRVILGYNGNDEVDHINQDKLDNQKKNLRVVPHFINQHNSKLRVDNKTGYKGVVHLPSGRWGYHFDFQGKRYTKGGFSSALEVREARISALQLKGITTHNL